MDNISNFPFALSEQLRASALCVKQWDPNNPESYKIYGWEAAIFQELTKVARSAGSILLGGDIYEDRGLGPEFSYATWATPRRQKNESDIEYREASYSRAFDYLNNYPRQPGRKLIIVPVFT